MKMKQKQGSTIGGLEDLKIESEANRNDQIIKEKNKSK